MKKLIKIFALLLSASMFFTSCEFGDVVPEEDLHSVYYVSEVEGYSSLYPYVGYEEENTATFFLEYKGANFPFCEYTVEVRKDSVSGEVVKTYTIKGDDVTYRDEVSVSASGKTSLTWEGVPDYSKFDAYVVLTDVKMPVVNVEFDKANSDFTDSYDFYFYSYEPDGENKYSSTLSKINDNFLVFLVSKTVGDPNEKEEGLDSSDIEEDFTLDITVDGTKVSNVLRETLDGIINYEVDWRKFTYDQLDPSKEHVIKVCVKAN